MWLKADILAQVIFFTEVCSEHGSQRHIPANRACLVYELVAQVCFGHEKIKTQVEKLMHPVHELVAQVLLEHEKVKAQPGQGSSLPLREGEPRSNCFYGL